MNALQRLAGLAPIFALLLTGCVSRMSIVSNSANATEERKLTAQHVSGAGLDVRTSLGSIEIVADPTATDVSVIAKISTSAETEDEAKARLAQVTVKLERRADRVLQIGVEYAKTLKNGAGCSIVVRLPDCAGVTANSGNGSVTLKGLGGDADAKSGIGAVLVEGQNGKVTATSGNGSVTVAKAVGAVHAQSDIGAVNVKDSGGAVTAKSGNGAVSVSNAIGSVTATSGIGSVKVYGATGIVDARSGNGAVHYSAGTGSTSAFHLKSEIGMVTANLPASFGGRIKTATSIGAITISGNRKPASVTGDKNSRVIVLTDDGPESTMTTGNGSITLTLE